MLSTVGAAFCRPLPDNRPFLDNRPFPDNPSVGRDSESGRQDAAPTNTFAGNGPSAETPRAAAGCRPYEYVPGQRSICRDSRAGGRMPPLRIRSRTTVHLPRLRERRQDAAPTNTFPDNCPSAETLRAGGRMPPLRIYFSLQSNSHSSSL